MTGQHVSPQHESERREAGPAWQLRQTVLLLLALAAAALCCYWPSFSAPFLFDDQRQILDRPEIRDVASPLALLFASRRPVLLFSLAGNYWLGEFDVRGYHVFNFTVHLLSGWTLFFLVRDTLCRTRSAAWTRGGAAWPAFAIALIWLMHPLQTQSVTYITQRCEALMGLFFLLLLYCLLRGSRSARPARWYLAAVACFALGIGSKEVMASAILVAPLYDRVFLANSWREVLRKRRGLYAACLAPLALLGAIVAYQSAKLPQMFGGFGNVGITSWEYLRSQPGVILHYLRLCFWPDRLCLDYDWPIANDPIQILVPGAVVVALLAGSLAAYRFRPALGLVALTFFLILAPSSSLMPIVDLAFEHRMYLPLACVVTLTVFAVLQFMRLAIPRRTWRLALLGMLLASTAAALGALTTQRNRMYLDPVLIWRDVVEQAPQNYKAFYNLGVALAKQKRDAEAIDAYGQALELRPRYTDARYNLALLLDARGELQLAKQHYLRLLEIDPRDAHASFNLAGIFHRTGNYEQAIAQYRQTLQLDPGHLRARGNLASLLARKGEYAAAERQLQAAIASAPVKAWLYDNYGNLYARQDRHVEAIKQYDQAIRVNINYAPAYLHKARALHEQGRSAEAIALLRASRGRFPYSAAAAHLLADLLVKAEPVQLRNAQEALSLISPIANGPGKQNYAVLSTMAACQAELGEFPRALTLAQSAIQLAQSSDQAAVVNELKRQRSLYAAGSRYRAKETP